MAEIFISYKSEERALPEALANDLRAAGYTVWWDVDLVGGATFRQQIREKLDAARAVIVIWTPASVRSEFVLDEADRAKRRGKLIPLRVPELNTDDIPDGHGQTQTYLLQDRQRIFGALQAMGVTPGAGPAAAPAPQAETADTRLWREVRAENSIEALSYYVRKFPQGAHAGEADDLIWGMLEPEATLAAYRRYLEAMPQGRHSAVAEYRAERLEEKLRLEAEAEQRKAEQQRREEERQRLEAEAERRKRDCAAWAKAEAGGAISDWRGYLAAFAQGEHSGDAGARIASREKAERLVRAFTGHAYSVWSVAFSPDGRFALSGSYDKTLKLWDVSTGLEVRAFTGHTSLVDSVAFSPDGRFALSGSWDNTLKLWEVSTGREVRAFTGHTSAVRSVAFSPDGRFALSGSADKTLKLWDVSTGREVRAFTGHTSLVTSVAFSPDGRFALSGSWDKTLKLWDVSTGGEVRAFTGHADYVNSVAFSPDGRLALSGSDDKTLKLWDVSTGLEVRAFTGHADYVTSVAFSPDGRYVVSGSGAWEATTQGYKKGQIKLWVASSGAEIFSCDFPDVAVWSVAFSPDGRFVLSGYGDNTCKLWDVSEWTQAP